jgi:hypothetical protein
MAKEETLKAVASLLRSQSTLALSTADADGQPHATPLFYLTGDDFLLYWFSSPSSLHSRNIAVDPRAAVSIYVPTEHWKEICGVQMSGVVSKVADRALRREISRAYRERFHLGNVFRVAIAKSALYRFCPHWIRYLDNTKRFGFKVEISLSDGR